MLRETRALDIICPHLQYYLDKIPDPDPYNYKKYEKYEQQLQQLQITFFYGITTSITCYILYKLIN